MDLPALKEARSNWDKGVAHHLPPCQLEQSLPCPPLLIHWLTLYLQYLQGLSFFFFFIFLVQRSWEMLWPVQEKGPLCIPAKTQLLLNPNWTAFPNYLHYSSGLYFF